MPRILICDDEKDVVTLIHFLLEQSGYEITEAYNGVQCLQILGIEPKAERKPEELPELIILDVMMPVVDGVTAARRLAEDPRTRNIPLFILTAKGGQQVKDLFKTAPNVRCFVEKPFDPKRLKALVDEVFPGKGGA